MAKIREEMDGLTVSIVDTDRMRLVIDAAWYRGPVADRIRPVIDAARNRDDSADKSYQLGKEEPHTSHPAHTTYLRHTTHPQCTQRSRGCS